MKGKKEISLTCRFLISALDVSLEAIQQAKCLPGTDEITGIITTTHNITIAIINCRNIMTTQNILWS